MKNYDTKELADFVQELSELHPSKIEVPGFSIPDFPSKLNVQIRLGWQSFLLPIHSKDTNIMVLEKCFAYLWFGINEGGVISFSGKIPFVPVWNRFKCDSTDRYDPLPRVQAVILFEQFKEEMFEKTITSLKWDKELEETLTRQVERAFKPFLPYDVAGRLS